MMDVRHNKRGVKIHETEWGEPEDCVAIATWSGGGYNYVAYED
jgi:hypothetical protein